MAVGDWNEEQDRDLSKAPSLLPRPGSKTLHDRTSDEARPRRMRLGSETDTRLGGSMLSPDSVKSINESIRQRQPLEPAALGTGSGSLSSYSPGSKGQGYGEALASMQKTRDEVRQLQGLAPLSGTDTAQSSTGTRSTGKRSFSAAQKMGLNRLSDMDLKNLRTSINSAGSAGEVEGTLIESKLRAAGKYDQKMKNTMQGYGQRERGGSPWSGQRNLAAEGQDMLTRQLVSDTLGVSDAQGRPPSRGLRRRYEAPAVPVVDDTAQMKRQQDVAGYDMTEAEIDEQAY